MLCDLCGIEMRRIAQRNGMNVFICRNTSCPNKDKEIERLNTGDANPKENIKGETQI